MITGRERFRSILLPLTALYGTGVYLRNTLYDRAGLPREHAGAPVVSIGNLTAGGTGKTPITRWLAGFLQGRGLRPAILLRGYRARGDSSPAPRWRSGLPRDALARWGDEALAHARGSDVPVYAHRDRRQSARSALAAGVNILVLDDGFQHQRLHRDLDIVCLDWERPLGRGGLLPAGDLREPPSALARCDLIFWTRWREPAPNATGRGSPGDPHRRLERWAAGRGSLRWVFESGPIRLAGSDEQVRPKRVITVAGIVSPDRFAESLLQAGLDVVGHRGFPDHHAFRSSEILDLEAMRKAAGAEMIVTSDKDEVRFLALPEGADLARDGHLAVAELRCRPIDALAPLEDRLASLVEPASRRLRS